MKRFEDRDKYKSLTFDPRPYKSELVLQKEWHRGNAFAFKKHEENMLRLNNCLS